MITSPDNDNDGLYDFNIDLLWTTEAPEGEIIRYRVLFAQIRFSDRCQPDGLEVYPLYIYNLDTRGFP